MLFEHVVALMKAGYRLIMPVNADAAAAAVGLVSSWRRLEQLLLPYRRPNATVRVLQRTADLETCNGKR